MPKLLENAIPKYRFHKSSGQAIVVLNGHDVCLGKHGTAASRAQYNQVIAEWIANGRVFMASAEELTVVELVDRYLPFIASYYRHRDGSPTTEADKIRRSMPPLVRLYRATKAAEFGPLALKVVRDAMINHGWCRNHINQNVGRIRRLFKWGVENELVPSPVLHGLQAVAGLKAGRSEARESNPVTPVPEDQVLQILPYCSRQVAAMVRLQLLAGMRPGEVCQRRGADVATTGKLWLYRPAQYKSLHCGHDRIVYLGPQAKQITQEFLKPELKSYLFYPADADRERRAARHARRKTPLSCGNTPGSNVRRNPRRAPSDHYEVRAYARAIRYACEAAFLPPDFGAISALRPRSGPAPIRPSTAATRRVACSICRLRFVGDVSRSTDTLAPG
ncbi:MAG: recombinase XerD [Planctomycetota bacterium]|nr:recombinase XerD [Planctomycetota bacterium]